MDSFYQLNDRERTEVILGSLDQETRESIKELANVRRDQKIQRQIEHREKDKNLRSGLYAVSFLCAILGIFKPLMLFVSFIVLIFGMIITTDW